MKTLPNGIQQYETKASSPNEQGLASGPRLVEVAHLPGAKVRVKVRALMNEGNCRFKTISDEEMFSEDFEQYLLPLIH